MKEIALKLRIPEKYVSDHSISKKISMRINCIRIECLRLLNAVIAEDLCLSQNDLFDAIGNFRRGKISLQPDFTTVKSFFSIAFGIRDFYNAKQRNNLLE